MIRGGRSATRISCASCASKASDEGSVFSGKFGEIEGEIEGENEGDEVMTGCPFGGSSPDMTT
jgi:hypothetical protein